MAMTCYNQCCKQFFKQCFTNNRGCCHCYTEKYMNRYSDNKYLCCPGTHCTVTSCEEYCDGETGNTIEYTSENCFNSPSDPCCHDCSLIFCPIALAIDIITWPFRTAKYHSHKCYKSNQKVIVSDENKPELLVIEMEPK
jgi:hypothetical protein